MDEMPLMSEIFFDGMAIYSTYDLYEEEIKVNDFDVLSPFPFGWLELFLFYLSSFFLFFILYKTQLYILCKKNRF